MPHKCGPMFMGVGWTEEFQSEVRIRSEYEKVPFVEQMRIEPCEDIVQEGKSNKVLVGSYYLNLEDFKDDKLGDEEKEVGKIELVKSKFFMNEVLEGQRNPKMMERIGFGTDPMAGKHMRLELERFQQVDFRYPAKLVWCGTSLSGGSLDEIEVSKQTRFVVRKLKAFTITSENAKMRPELNALSVLQEQIPEKSIESIVVVECGVNDITNISEESEGLDRLHRVNLKMRELVSIASELKRRNKLEKVVLLQRIPRLDEKSQLSQFSDQAMLHAVCEANDPRIIVRTLQLSGTQDSLFGTPGLRNPKGQFPDRLHLRGPHGRAAFTKAAIEMLESI